MSWLRSLGRGIKSTTNKALDTGSDYVRGATTATLNTGRAGINIVKAGGNALTGDFSGAGKNLNDAKNNVGSAINGATRAVSAPIGFIKNNNVGLGIVGGLIENLPSKSTPAQEPAQTPALNPAPAPAPAPAPTTFKPQKNQQQIEEEQQAEANKIISNPNISNAKTAPSTNIKRYELNSFNGSPANEQEQLYQDYVTNGMKTGRFADVESALNRTSRENALDNARSQMMGEAQASKAGYQAGTSEYARAIDLKNADAQSRNLDRNNAVNALQRGAVTDVMNRGQQLGQQQYGRQLDERSHAEGLDAIQYNQDRTGYTDQRSEINDFIAGLSPQAQNVAKTLLAQGKDPRFAGLTTSTGAMQSAFRGLTPEQQNQASVLEQARSRVPQMDGESDSAYEQRLQQEVVKQNRDTYQTAYNPINSATRQNDVDNKVNSFLEESAKTGKNLDAKTWKTMNQTRPDLVNSIPISEKINGVGYAKTAKAGDVIEYNGQKYVVVDPAYHHTRQFFYNTYATDGIMVINENGDQEFINKTKEYDAD